MAALLLQAADVAVAQRLIAQSISEADQDEDGKLARSEAPIRILADFDQIDDDSDGYIDAFEARQWDARALGVARRAPESRATLARPKAVQPDRSIEGLIRRLDRDRDGRVSREELPEQHRSAMDRFDLDKDGYIGQDDALKIDARMRELAAQSPSGAPDPRAAGPTDERGPGGGRTIPRLVQLMDTNGDGVLQKREAPLRMQRNWDRYDHNGNGEVDMVEATTRPRQEPKP